MAKNLYTGAEGPVPKTGEGVNLYQTKAKYAPDPERPEYKPYINDIANSFIAGSASIGENLARVPAAIYDAAAIPQNFLFKALGRDDLQVKSPDWLMDNPVAEYYESQADQFREDVSPKKTFEEALSTGDWSGMGRSISLSVIENAPQQVGLIATYLAGTPLTGLVGMGMMSGADSLKQGREKGADPAMNAYNAVVNGTLEGLMENMGTMGILKHWSTAMAKSFGKKAGREVMGDMFKAIFYSALGEGNEEFWTSLGQDFSSYATGVDKNALKGAIPRAFEAGTVGAASGGAMTGPVAIRTGAQSAALNKMQDEIYAAHEKVAGETKPGFTPQTDPETGAPVGQNQSTVSDKVDVREQVEGAFTLENEEGQTAFGKVKDGNARIVGIDANDVKGSNWFGKVIGNLKKMGAKSITVRIQSEGSRAALKRLVEKGVLTNPRDMAGISVDQHPTTFDIAEKVKPTPKPTLQDNLKEKLGELQDKEAKRSYLKDALKMVEEARKAMIGRIRKYKDDVLAVELQSMPKKYVTEKGGITVDVAMQELREQGEDIKNEADLVDYLMGLEKRRAELQSHIKDLQPKTISQREPSFIKKRLADIASGFRSGAITTAKQIKAMQTEVIEVISMLEKKDQAKFIKTIKNVKANQSPELLEAFFKDLANRVEKVWTQSKKAEIKEKIKKQLSKTKAVKKGDLTAGKYDYESNMFFKDVRRAWKLNKATALLELEGMPTENLSEMDLIKKRIMSLKANGAEASLEIYKQVLADVKMLKEYGEAAKSDEDFDKRVARQERVDEFLAGSEKTSGGETFLLSKLKRGYIRGVGTTHTFLNALFGTKVAEQYDTEIYEAERMTAVWKVTERVTKRAAEIYGVRSIIRQFESMAKEAPTEVTEQTEKGTVKELSRMQLIDIYSSIKNPATKEAYVKLYGEEQLNEIMGKLEPQDKALGDMLQEEVQAYRDIMNKKSIEIKGEDMGMVENYWPRKSEHIQNVFDDWRQAGSTARSIKSRKDGSFPVPQDAWSVFDRSVEEAEYTDKVSRPYETLKRILNDREIEPAVTKKFGKKVWAALQNQVDASSLNAHMQFVDAMTEKFSWVLNNWVKAKIASPTVLLRQAGSMSNFMENMPADQWVKGFGEAIKPMNAKNTFDYMWNTIDYLPARFKKGYKEALSKALDDAKNMSANQEAWSRGLTAGVRAGDVGAIIFGGYPYMMYLQSKEGGGLTEKQAVKKFVKVALKSQQSPFPAGTSAFQRRGGATGFLSAFRNTSSQYARKMGDALIQYKNGEISGKQLSKIWTIYGVIQPTLYVTIGYAYKMALVQVAGLVLGQDRDWELEKLMDDIIVQIITNPVNFFPVVSDIVKYAAREMVGQKGFDIGKLPMIGDVEVAMGKAYKKEVTFEDYITIVGTAAELGASIPVLTLQRMYKYIMGDNKKSGSGGSTAGKII